MERTNDKEASRQLCERAYQLFDEFRSAYRQEWLRLENNERIYRGDHWYDVPVTDEHEPRPVTPIIQSTVENVSADLMDQVPEVFIEPQDGVNDYVARVVQSLIRRNHDVSGYTVEYQKLVHDLLVGGYCVQEVGYDPSLNSGLGGAFIRHVDDRSILFDPLCDDMQEGRAVFKLSLRTREWIKDRFPLKYPEMGDDPYVASDAPADDILRGDRRNSVLLLEYWWKTPTERDGVFAVHMALIAGGVVLADSREFKPQGYFAHGMYPFVLTPLYMRKGSPLGFGIVDLFEKQQRYADKLDQIVLKNAFMASHNKLLITEASGFDEEDLKDWSKEVHRGESLNGVTWFSTPPLPAYLMTYIQRIREDRASPQRAPSRPCRWPAPSGLAWPPPSSTRPSGRRCAWRSRWSGSSTSTFAPSPSWWTGRSGRNTSTAPCSPGGTRGPRACPWSSSSQSRPPNRTRSRHPPKMS